MLAKMSPRGARRQEETEFDMLVSGDWYSPEAVSVAATKIREYYGEVGYLNARVSVSREPNTETGTVDLVFNITENEKSYLRSISIDGNNISKSEIILRELALSPGEVFDVVRMKTSERRVRGTRYFDYVAMQPVDTGIPSQKDLRISVREGRTGSLSFGAGFSTVESVSGFAEFQQSNFDLFNARNKFRGGGQKFRFRVQIGTRSTSIIQSLEEPMLFGRELALGYEIYHKSNRYISSDYDTIDTGLKVYVGRRVIENIRAELYYKIDNYEITDIESDVPQFIHDEEGYTLLSRGGIVLSRDRRDDVLFPTSGNRIQLRGEIVGGPFMGDCDYYSLDLQAAQWFPVVGYDQSLKIGGRIGTMHSYGGSYVPFFERLYLGGPYNLRGFRYGHVGPFIDDEPTGGQSRFYITAEYTFRILDELRLAFFYDGGFVNKDSFDFSPNDWNDDIGFGFRILMLGALMNIDFGFPITVSVSLSPMLGIHIHNTDRGLQLNTYINSLLWSLSPQLGIRYRVGERRNAPDRASGADGIPEYKRKFPRLTFGVEWGYAATFLCTFHHNYRAEDRYRVNDKGTKAMYEGNGHILAHLGANLGRHYNLSFYTGYEGIADGFCVIPMTLRHTWLFGDRAENSRWLCFADAGYGLRAEGDSNCFIAKAGGGYRVSFSRSVKMDFLLTYRFAYAEIPFSDESGTVPQDRINRNNNFLNAISIGIGLTL